MLGTVLMAPANAAKWEPVPPADLEAKDSTVFPGADVEILVSRHQVDETNRGRTPLQTGDEPTMVTQNYIRAKIYTAKGVEDLGKFPISYHSSRTIWRKDARVVKPDGTSIELKKTDMFEKVLAKSRKDGEFKQLTFVFPGLEPGDVVEYSWEEQINRALWLEIFFCQETLPVREYRFKVGDLQGRGSIGWLHCPEAETSEKDGFELILRKLPAFEEEEHMPPQLEFRGWVYVTKTFQFYPTDKDVWKALSSEWGDTFNMATRPGNALKQKAAALAAGAASDDEKLKRLYDYCQREIFNTTYRTSAELQAGIQKHRNESANSPAKILELQRGRADEINLLFATLARALGYEVRQANNASRDVLLNVTVPRGWAFVDATVSVAVKVGTDWRYFNPGCYLLPFGLMASDDEGATALLCDTKKLEYGVIGCSTASDNLIERKGRFTLDSEGMLVGDVEIILRGHQASTRKSATWSQSLEEATEDFRKEITARMPNAEVTAIQWTNLENQYMPVIVRYRVRVPGYAEQVGKRLVFAPGFFESGKPLELAATERKFPIFFTYPWQEHDDVEIVLPPGFTLDKPSAPAAVGDPQGALGATYKMQYNGKTRTFGLVRDFALGGNGAYQFRQESYPALRSLFAQLHRSDTHTIVLKPKEPAASPAASTVPSDAPAAGAVATEAQP